MIIDAKVDPDQLEALPPFSRRDPHATPSRAYSVPAGQDSTEYDRHRLLPPPPHRLGGHRAAGSTPDLKLVVESPTGSSIQTSPTLPGSSSQAGLGQWHATGSSLTLIPLHFMQKGSIPITGTYHIDPRASAVGFDDTKGFQSKKKAHPQASFRTKHGEVSLSLSTTGKTKREGQKVDVLVASWSGNITVQLLTPAPESPAMGLEVFSVRGDILLLLPLTYSGMFHVKTHWGSLKFLPNFKKAMKIIHEADSEAIVMLGDHLVKDKSPVNFAQMKTRFGSIIIGFSGVDSHDFKNGFWQTVMKRF